MIHCIAHSNQSKDRFSLTIVYGFNEDSKRVQLWEDLEDISAQVQGPWLLMGDFNDIPLSNERVGRRNTKDPTQEFRDCVDHCQLEDLKHYGAFFTWNNKQQPEDRVFSKIDRALVNSAWVDSFHHSEAVFLPEDAVNFDEKIAKSWQEGVVGTDMFKLTVKLKRLKQVLKSINKEGFNDLQKKEMLAKEVLLVLQGKVNTDPLNSKLLLEEQAAREQDTKIYKAYSLFLAQKAKTSWAKNGDDNTAIFHASLRARRTQNRVFSIEDEQGNWCDTPESVQNAFLQYFQQLLGSTMSQRS
ncbi:uncharacterized protein LOC133833064 [Humulus lupulus]|uniref:uncharacterized protein LOC133833064 n=1 Tax=Humulus lupulus TaxID=3486 RepID=UPI002B40DEFA|nr:uncharacterized protein LOC133833064 [Humulus lupulus]